MVSKGQCESLLFAAEGVLLRKAEHYNYNSVAIAWVEL